jgi:hypothetical protein
VPITALHQTERLSDVDLALETDPVQIQSAGIDGRYLKKLVNQALDPQCPRSMTSSELSGANRCCSNCCRLMTNGSPKST